MDLPTSVDLPIAAGSRSALVPPRESGTAIAPVSRGSVRYASDSRAGHRLALCRERSAYLARGLPTLPELGARPTSLQFVLAPACTTVVPVLLLQAVAIVPQCLAITGQMGVDGASRQVTMLDSLPNASE